MTEPSARVLFGGFEIDVKAGELSKRGRRIRLQEQPLRVLLALLETPGATVTREEFRDRLWPAETFVDFDNALNNIINRLRVALGDSASAPRLVETVGRRGYRFIGEVTQRAATLAAPPNADDRANVADASPTLPLSIGGGLTASRLEEQAPPATPPVRWRLVGAAVAAALVLIVGGAAILGPARLAAWLDSHGLSTSLGASPGIRSLGILPMAPLSKDSSDDLFAYGIVNALIAELSRFQALKLVSSSSGVSREQLARPPQQLARELGVDTLLRGSVTRNAEHAGVTVELIDARTGRPVWTQAFTRPAADLLSLRSAVVNGVAGQVQARLTPGTPVPGQEPVTANSQAYEAYLRGQFETLRRTPPAFARAVSNFEHALSLDPNYAPAHAGLAWARLQQSSWAGDDHPRQHADEVTSSIGKALALDPNLAEAHVALAMASRLYAWDWVGAETAIKRAIQLKPSSPMAHNEYTRLLQCLGRFAEALGEAQKALALDPRAAVYWLNEGNVLANLRRLGDAEDRYKRALALDPNFSGARLRLVRLYLGQHRIDEARETFRQLELQPARNSVRVLGAHLQAAAGNPSEAKRLLAALDATTLTRDLAAVAATHLSLGNRAAALAAVRRGVDEKSLQPSSFVGAEFDAIRGDSEFAGVLQQMRLPPASVKALVALPSPREAATVGPSPMITSR